jgi:hypothetical protein
MRKSILLLFICLLSILSCDTSESLGPEESYFLKFYGNQGNQVGVDFVVNPDGTFVLLGNSKDTTSTDQDIYLAKIDQRGKIIWEKTFGENKLNEQAKDIELQSDGSLIVLANVEVSVGNRDVYLLKLTQEGVIINEVKQGLTDGTSERDDDANSITIISDGYMVAGGTSKIPRPLDNRSDFMHMRFRNDLTFLKNTIPDSWKSVNGFTAGEDVAVKIIPSGSDFYLMGYSDIAPGYTDKGDFNFFVIKISALGEIISGPIFIGQSSFDERLISVSIVPPESGSGYLLTGSSQNLNTKAVDAHYVLLPSNLGFGNNITVLNGIRLGENLGENKSLSVYNAYSKTQNVFLIATEKDGPDGSKDIYYSRWRPDGDNKPLETFEQPLGGVGEDLAGPIVELPDGRVVMIGTMTLGGQVNGQSKIVFIKLNPQGRLAP